VRGFAAGSGQVLVVAEHDGKQVRWCRPLLRPGVWCNAVVLTLTYFHATFPTFAYVPPQLTGATLAAITAASKLGSVSLLVAGDSADAVAQVASQVAGVSKVLVAKDAAYNNGLPENYSNLVASVQKKGNFNYVVAAHTAFGKNFMPRLSAQLDAAQVSDVMAVEGPDTFVRPIYAGNAIATVKTVDPVKVLTVRPTSFDKAATTGGSAAVEPVPAADKFGTPGRWSNAD